MEQLEEELVGVLREKLGNWVEDKHKNMETPTQEEKEAFAEKVSTEWVDRLAEKQLDDGNQMLTSDEEDSIISAARNNVFGAGLWEKFLNDKNLSDIHINGYDVVWLVDRNGNKTRGEPIAKSNEELIQQIRWAGSQLGRSARRFDSNVPILNMRLPSGARLHAIMDVSTKPMVTIRLHDPELTSLSHLKAEGMFDQTIASFLQAAVKGRFNVVICGGMGVGKTTLCRAL